VREELADVARKQGEHRVLVRRQLHRLAADRDGPLLEVDLEVSDDDERLRGLARAPLG
jgi:hypothetical protein